MTDPLIAIVERLLDRELRASQNLTPKSERPRCGARTRKGTPCQAPALWDKEHNRPRNGRCRLHGGLSTGPRTTDGANHSLEALQHGHQAWRERHLAQRNNLR